MREGWGRSLAEGLEIEREATREVFGSPVASNLIAVFFLKRQRARDPGVDNPTIEPRLIGRLGVLGSGQMGGAIAAASAFAAIPAVLVDVDHSRVESGILRARRAIATLLKSTRKDPGELDPIVNRIETATTPNAFAHCDLVVEAVPEDTAIKAAAFRSLAGILGDSAILASNTSTIPISQLALAAPAPRRFAGLHFFHPVERMELIEVIRGQETDDTTIASLVALARRLGKIPIVVRDGPGFLVSRLLAFYLREAIRLFEEGASLDSIDEAAERFGMPMGPMALIDLIGVDTVGAILSVMATGFPGRMSESALLADLSASGRLGQKAGAGLRSYGEQRQAGLPDPVWDSIAARHCRGSRQPSSSEIVDRLFLSMLQEAARVLDDGLVRQPGDVDLGMILGLGFPAFRGGLLRWTDHEGLASILGRLERLEHLGLEEGERFRPVNRLRRMASSGERFFPGPAR
jgi:3-hydroxyacyl-CoA dehydrogenase/enoyl-CoA hydratase/3-hydroxybutyryl-CoA epimerase/3-hydroxyacyl-CoA dehydrogenase/enoyl-CoA hydratase/3-hydroxybutyryl-CoA epimerase/enoyl-CoA isomerase